MWLKEEMDWTLITTRRKPKNNNRRKYSGKELQGRSRLAYVEQVMGGCRLHNVCGNEKKAERRLEWRAVAKQYSY
jgi:hypothetical protein